MKQLLQSPVKSFSRPNHAHDAADVVWVIDRDMPKYRRTAKRHENAEDKGQRREGRDAETKAEPQVVMDAVHDEIGRGPRQNERDERAPAKAPVHHPSCADPVGQRAAKGAN
jgi:hypothetical protein